VKITGRTVLIFVKNLNPQWEQKNQAEKLYGNSTNALGSSHTATKLHF